MAIKYLLQDLQYPEFFLDRIYTLQEIPERILVDCYPVHSFFQDRLTLR